MTEPGKTDLSDIVGGFQAMVGYRIVRWERDLAEVEIDVDAQHHNRSGFVHGGVHATLLDSAAGIAGVYCPVPGNVVRAVTLSFSIQYIAAARIGTLRAIGRRRGGGRSIFFAAAELFDAGGKLIATGEGTYRYIAGFEPPDGGPRGKG
ncbi:MAG: PaaI family thioesterase [Alphaproteobacteria bacterium]|nr:PaaI family thioesterase [Alphaproteobacteria bacterium]